MEKTLTLEYPIKKTVFDRMEESRLFVTLDTESKLIPLDKVVGKVEKISEGNGNITVKVMPFWKFCDLLKIDLKTKPDDYYLQDVSDITDDGELDIHYFTLKKVSE